MILAFSLGVGIGVQTVPELLDPLPEAVRLVFSSGITTGGISAFVLNAVLPSQPREAAVNGSTGATAEPLSARPSEESPLQISSWSCTAHATTAIGYRLQVTGCGLQVGGCGLGGCGLRTSRNDLDSSAHLGLFPGAARAGASDALGHLEPATRNSQPRSESEACA